MRHPLHRLFRPHALVADALQREFHLARPPACRMHRSRFEIVVRGAGLSREPLERCIALADAMVAAARPLLEGSHLRLTRRAARFAIRVSFDDEQIVESGVVGTRVSYLAAIGHDAAAKELPRVKSRHRV